MENTLLSWILIAAVALSLALSVVTLILQILRGRSSKNIVQARGNPRGGPPQGPPPARNNPYMPQQQAWVPPVAPVRQSGHTEPLFSASPSQQSFTLTGSGTEQVQSGTYKMRIRESSPAGDRSYDITVRGEFPIGRSSSSGLQIDNPTVSGTQCVFIAGPDAVFVSNRSNSNITRLNGAQLGETRPLKQGDTLNLGNVQLSLLDIQKHAR